MVWKKILFEVLKTAAMVSGHNDSSVVVSLQSPVIFLTNLTSALYKYADFFQFSIVQNSNFSSLCLSNIYMTVPFILIGIIPHDSTLKHYFVEK